ncbi:MAG TPA: PBP1A family penicillin-binding protein [Candidatus Methylomirabilis sp.]|nr:PBP1A family penicillin-binding protein [Candidatus Methylomirabilis sp.]
MPRTLDPEEPAGFPWNKLLLILFVAGLCFVLGVGAGIALLARFGDFPQIESAAAYKPSVTSKIFDRNNRVVGEIYLEKRNVVPYKAIPPHVVYAFLAAEDANFFKHRGVDYFAIARAIVKDVLSGGFAQGASTITQQTVKSLFLTPEKSVARKLKELILAWRIERKLTKEEILYLYLNQIYLGDGAYGVEAAAQTYFSRGVSSLTVAEGALLAGLAQAPTRYSPRGHLDKAKARQRYVLRRMAEEGFLDKNVAEKAYDARLALAPPSTFRSKAAYFLEYVRNYLQEKYGMEVMYRSEFKIYTTIDGRLQEAAYDAVTQGVRRMEEANRYKGLQGALVCMDPNTGGVLAMVGGVDFAASQFNRALQARRQPGSAFKPIVYSAALDKGKTVVSTIDDSPIEFSRNETEMWKPKNYDGTFLGPIPLLEALAKSRNLATVRLLNEIGVDTAIRMARDLGIQSPIERNLSIALGSSGVTPLEMVTAYSTFAGGGRRPTPFFIREVQDAQGQVLERTEPKVVPAIAPETAFLTIRLMQEVLRTGTGVSAKGLSPNLAGKTGTTNENTDAWFIGGSPDLIAGVWVGFDTPTSLGGRQTAASVALPIWSQFFGRALGAIPDREYPAPAGITFARVDPSTGKAVPQGSSEGMMLPFKLGTVPETGGPAGKPGPPRRGAGDDLL